MHYCNLFTNLHFILINNLVVSILGLQSAQGIFNSFYYYKISLIVELPSIHLTNIDNMYVLTLILADCLITSRVRVQFIRS